MKKKQVFQGIWNFALSQNNSNYFDISMKEEEEEEEE